jgi:hypothetical protein
MFSRLPRPLQALAYEEEALAYLGKLPPRHFRETTAQATQRGITLSSLALVAAHRREVQVFNKLLVQYPLRGRRKPGQIVPDNMIVLTTERVHAVTSYKVALEPSPPFWVLEYVSIGRRHKDYEKNFRKYERDLKVPYYLLFYPDTQDMGLYRLRQGRYGSVKPNRHGRCPIRKLDMEVGRLDGWVRYWFEGELLPLPADLQRGLDAARRQAAEEKQRADAEQRRADDEKRRADELQQRLEAAERELRALRARQGQP